MKKVLILSCSTGQGHNSCAQAVEEYFKMQGLACEVRDALDFISPKISHLLSWGHSWIYRHTPWLFRFGYHFSEVHPGVFEKNAPAYRLLTAGTDRLYAYIDIHQFDTVICTHAFSALIFSHVLERHPMDVQNAFVGTDYTCSPSTEVSHLQRYFIPAASLIEDYTRKGIPAETLIPSGIPVCQAFLRQTEKADAKRLVGIGANHKHLLIACGSMGCGPLVSIVRQTARNMDEHTEISVICGTNARLYRKLSRRFGQNPRVHIVGYTKQMSLYLDSADLYLTKPGGISITEAAIKHLPMAFVNAVDGCETYNMQFFLATGGAFTAPTARKLSQESLRLLGSPLELAAMEQALVNYAQPSGAEAIYRELKGEPSFAQRKYG